MADSTPTLAALLKALRQAPPGPAASSAMDQAADRLISSPSLSEAQQLVSGLQQCARDHHSALTESLYAKLQQAASICTEPTSKAQYLGFALLQESVHLLETLEVSTQRQVLLKVFNANNGVLPGYLAALTAPDGPFFSPTADCNKALRTLQVVAPVFKNVLMDNLQAEGHTAAVLDVLNRIAWHFDGQSEGNEAVRTSVVRILVQAMELVPHSQLSQTTYVVHVTMVADLLSSFAGHNKEQVELAKQTAHFVLESMQVLIGKDVGILALLQSLEQLAQDMPEALWCSVFLTSSAYLLVDKCETPLEQQLMLRVLTRTLEFGLNAVSRQVEKRGVYVEVLLLPLTSMLSHHDSAVTELLKLVVTIQSTSNFHHPHEIKRDALLTETATHAFTAMRLINDEAECERWLSSLFLSNDVSSSGTNTSADKWLALVLVALLSDRRSVLRGSAAGCLARQVNSSPKCWGTDVTKALVASLVFLISQRHLEISTARATSARRFGEWMDSCLHSLAALAATTTDTMRTVLRLIDSMNGNTKMRSTALRLMYEVWRNESRAFPRLEAMLLESTTPDKEVERHIVKMATIKTLCEKDPELGVQFISSIQGFLEDTLESVVSMAMDAITALCRGDCLDFYVAFKIIAQKMRKNKVTCADGPLFQERLCCFYALGGTESKANEKHASKLLNQAWEFADSEYPHVRKAAYAAMCNFPLDMLSLCMPVDENMEQDSDSDDQVTEEEIEEQIDDLLQRLKNEHDHNVRTELENLVARVIHHESTKLTAGVGRGQRMASAASGDKRQQFTTQQSRSVALISAAATREMKALLPSKTEVLAMVSTTSPISEWSAFLLAYQPKAVIDWKSVKRKDKLVRLATQNVDELLETVTTVLQSVELPWTSVGSSKSADENCNVFLLIQAFMEGWAGFMSTYLASLDELAELKTPVGVDDADVAFRVFSEGVASLADLLLNRTSNNLGGTVAAGALAGRLCESRHWDNPQLRRKYEDIVEELSRRLALSMEHARVFSANDGDAYAASIGASLALQLAFGQRMIDASEDCSRFCSQLEKIEHMLMELYCNGSDELLAAFALLGLNHISVLYTHGNDLEAFEVTQWRQQRVKPLAELILTSFLHAERAKEQNRAASSNLEAVFPLYQPGETSSSIQKLVALFDQDGGILLRWVACVGLARLANGFAIIKRLDWLTNVQQVLSALWEASNSSSIVAIALGPVLLQCVYFNLAPSSTLDTFVGKCVERTASCRVDNIDSGFLVMAAAHVLPCMETLGGFTVSIQNQTRVVVDHIQRALESESGHHNHMVYTLVLSSIANFFHLPFGFFKSFVFARPRIDGSELTLDFDIIATLVKFVRDESKIQPGFSCSVLSAIARVSDGFYVLQKKKSFDVEVRSLPPRSLLVKTLEWLRQTNPTDDTILQQDSPVSDGIPQTAIARSLLSCLASTGSVLPLFDYASFTRRVMLRFCSIDTTVACVRFAATQGSCDELVAGELMSSAWFGNADTNVQTELLMWVASAATRVPTDVLRALLETAFDVLKDIWRRDTSASTSAVLFDSWTRMLGEMLDSTSTRQIPESSLEMLNQLVLDKIVEELPLGLNASSFVQQFAARVLPKVDYGDRGCANTFLMRFVPSSSMWSWWRSGIFVVELADLKVLTITKREASLVLQWILRHDFDEWTDCKDVNMYLLPLISRMGGLVAQHTRPGEIVSSLLDVIDAFGRGMSSLDLSVRSDTFKCRALFDVVACVLSWNLSLSHEQYLLKIARSEEEIANMTTDLLPFGLVSCAQNAKSVSALGERLLALLHQLIRLNLNEAIEYSAALQICSRQMYVTAETWHIPHAMPGEIREFWSVSDTN